MWEFIKELANWIGWFPITVGAVIVMLLGRYFYDREIAFKNLQIDGLKDDLEDSKQYRVDVLVQNLSQRIKVSTEELERLNNEVETENRKRSLIEKEKTEIQKQLDLAQLDALALKERLEPLERELDDLLGERAEPDFCRVCDVDDEHVMMNTIIWGYEGDKLIGDPPLVESEGTCLYCGSTNLKCKICGSITGIDNGSLDDIIECAGECGTVYTQQSFFGDRSERKIKVLRMVHE